MTQIHTYEQLCYSIPPQYLQCEMIHSLNIQIAFPLILLQFNNNHQGDSALLLAIKQRRFQFLKHMANQEDHTESLVVRPEDHKIVQFLNKMARADDLEFLKGFAECGVDFK